MASSDKKLGLFSATMLVMGGIIGVGIFFQPGNVATKVPEPLAFYTMWLLGGLAALAGAMTFAELSGTFPKAGGWYVFLREAFGGFVAFLFAWLVLFVISTGASAVVANFCAEQIVILGEDLVGLGLLRAAPDGDDVPGIAVGIVLAVTGIAWLGVKSGALFQNAVMVLKLTAIAAFVLAGFALFAPGSVESVTTPVSDGTVDPSLPLWKGMLQAAMPVLFSYGGWQLAAYIAQHVDDPGRTLPRAVLTGVVGVVVVYLATNGAYLRVVGIEGMQESGFAAEVARRSLGPRGGTFLVAAMAVSSLGIVAAILLATPGLYVAMSAEGLFPRAIGAEHPGSGAPRLALLIQGVMVLVYLLAYGVARTDALTGTVVFAEWIFHALTGVALIRLRATRPDLPRPFRSWLFPLFPATYSVLGTAVVVGTLCTRDRAETLTGLGVLAVGAVVYVPWRRLAARG